MLGAGGEPRTFHAGMLAGADEPVRRFFTHALVEGTPLHDRVMMRMHGRIRAGLWLPFSAEQTTARDGFRWDARVAAGPLTVLRVTDRLAGGRGSTEGRLLGRVRLFGADDEDTARSAAGRAALEAVAFAPATVLPGAAVRWTAESDELIVARMEVAPEAPDVHVRLDAHGAIRSVSAMRWGTADGGRGYVPCGCTVLAERRFGGVAVPSRVSVGWWFGTARHRPFFHAEVDELTPG